MSAIGRIRKEVLGQSQAELAALTGVAQATVSRWESGELTPGFRELNAIRIAGRSKRPDEWRDEWLFDGPPLPDLPPKPEAA